MIENVTALLPVLERKLRTHELTALAGAPFKSEVTNEKDSKKTEEKAVLYNDPVNFELAKYLATVEQKYLFSTTPIKLFTKNRTASAKSRMRTAIPATISTHL